MKIYIAHSKLINYIDELYKPIKEMNIYKNHEIIFPHENDSNSNNTREFYKTIDIVIAECSEPATGLGIELGWLYDDNKKIYCIHRNDKKTSASINVLTNNIYKYSNIEEMKEIIINIIKGEE